MLQHINIGRGFVTCRGISWQACGLPPCLWAWRARWQPCRQPWSSSAPPHPLLHLQGQVLSCLCYADFLRRIPLLFNAQEGKLLHILLAQPFLLFPLWKKAAQALVCTACMCKGQLTYTFIGKPGSVTEVHAWPSTLSPAEKLLFDAVPCCICKQLYPHGISKLCLNSKSSLNAVKVCNTELNIVQRAHMGCNPTVAMA